ncbi:maestro heat-like repeat-containing protein family member 7 isoform X2 [Anser cygnoides]|uniref:maestro heat-like repeat-containing protein family member 7 isoform X2 n=1 Tax=Anser cygnoides TaxID=8845 RepID=UPI0034D1C58E
MRRKMSPMQPRLAWQETWSSEGSSRPAEDSLLAEGSSLAEVCELGPDDLLDEECSLSKEVAQPEPIDETVFLENPLKAWDLYKDSVIEFIEAYVSGTEKNKEAQKMLFLSKICGLCRTVSEKGLTLDLHAFCRKNKLVENIMALLEKEPLDSLRTEFRQKAMETIAVLSNTVVTALDGKKESLRNACYRSVFFLPPESDAPETERKLYTKVLLDFAGSKNSAVRERAVRRIERLSAFIVSYFVDESSDYNQKHKDSHDDPRELCIPILGQLLGYLFIVSSGKDSISCAALGALFGFYEIISEGRECSLTKDMENYAERRKNLKDTTYPSYKISTPCEIAKAFGGYLFPSERLDIILTALEALPDSSIHDKKGACSLLDAALDDPDYWLTDVPMIMDCIRKNLDSIHTASVRRCLDSLLLQLTNLMSREDVQKLLKFSPPSDSTALGMWQVVLAMPQALEKVLNALLEDLPLRNWCTTVTEDTCIRRLAMLAQNHVSEEEFGNPVHLQSYLKHPSPEMRLTVLKGLSTVSESPEKARKIQVVLPDILEALQDTNADVVLKALLVLRNVMARVERREAGRTALQLAEKLLPLFDHESSQVREHSICLFQAVTEAVLRQRKRALKRTVHSSLLPLYFRMRDQSESVAKASGEALVVAAEFLRRKELKHLAQTEQTCRIGECLLQQDGGRVEEYLQQSQPYLQDSQTVLRLEAVRFIGLAARYSGDQSEEKQNEIISVLRSSGKDVEPMVRCLAAQTIMILASRRNRTSGRRFRQLWCF